jgi:hypothetical protein
VILEVVIGNDSEQRYTNTEHGCGVNIKAEGAVGEPQIFYVDGSGSGGTKIRERRRKGCDERSDNKKVTQVTNEVMQHREYELQSANYRIK